LRGYAASRGARWNGDNIFFGWHLNLDWPRGLPPPRKVAQDGYGLFGFFVVMLLFKASRSRRRARAEYDMQRVLSAKNPREASMMSAWVNIVLTPPALLLRHRLTVLAAAFYWPNLQRYGTNMDFELVLALCTCASFRWACWLPHRRPAGGFMSNFAATVNARAAYFVNDIYKPLSP